MFVGDSEAVVSARSPAQARCRGLTGDEIVTRPGRRRTCGVSLASPRCGGGLPFGRFLPSLGPAVTRRRDLFSLGAFFHSRRGANRRDAQRSPEHLRKAGRPNRDCLRSPRPTRSDRESRANRDAWRHPATGTYQPADGRQRGPEDPVEAAPSMVRGDCQLDLLSFGACNANLHASCRFARGVRFSFTRRKTLNLPKTLDREPLVDAVFEVRMGGTPQLADLLPGALFGHLTPKPTLQRLPAADVPQPIRDQDPNLVFSPVIRLDWREFTISFGDRNMVIACKMPYPKWPAFKGCILDIVRKVANVGIVGPVERYSVKYVNLIQAPTFADQIGKINISVKIGDIEAKDNHVSVQLHSTEDDTLHIVSVVTGARGRMSDGRSVLGAIVDIDSIRNIQFSDFGSFALSLEPGLESLRQSNKFKFFGCLTDAAIHEMGPRYV